MSAPSVTAAATAAKEAAAAYAVAQEASRAADEEMVETRAKIEAGDKTVSVSDMQETAARAEYLRLAITPARVEAEATDAQHRRAQGSAAAARATAAATGLPARDAAVAKAEAEITAAVRKLRASLSARDDLIEAVHGELRAAAPADLDNEGVLPEGYQAHSFASGLAIDAAGIRHNLSTHDDQLEKRLGASVRAAIAEPMPGGGPNQDQMPSGFRVDYVARALR